MNPQTATDFVAFHQQALLDEADKARLASLARTGRPRSTRTGGASALRRAVAWTIINAGIWLAGGSVESAAASATASR